MIIKNKGKFKTKVVGFISEKIAKENKIEEYVNKEIIQSTRLDIHTNKHANNFFSIDSYHNTLSNVDKIIEEPYYVEYDSNKQSLKYYGKVDQYVCVVVKMQNKRELYVSTFYPQSKEKIDKLNEELKQAIKEERYEDAAKLRDEIKKLC